MNELAARQFIIIEELESELQQQKGMLWVLGEIMKVANNIDSFKELMKLITDMLMGVTGVNTCYLWAYDEKEVRVYLRSTAFNNEFLELDQETIQESIKDVAQTILFGADQIQYPLIKGCELPESRLIVPLMNFNDNSVIGGLVLEQQQKGFFTTNNTIFFETLATFIASNAKNSRLYEQVAEVSETDPLTGVYNRRHLSKMLEAYIQESAILSVAVIDTDNFKAVNDFLGHIKGDEVLQAIAKGAKQYLKKHKGTVVRYGGDEFVLLIPKGIKESLKIFTEFQQLVPSLPVISEISIPVTITMGVCSYPDMTLDLAKIVQAADNALLRGKDAGKNRVIVASYEDCECRCLIK